MKNNNNLLYLIIVVLIVLIVLCLFLWRNDEVESPAAATTAENLLKNYITNTALLSSGMNFNTGEVIVLNNLTGEKVNACKGNGCRIEILNPDENLIAALKASEKTFEGKIRKGKTITSAKISTQVIIAYQGSMCTTNVVGGIQFTTCVEKINYCNSMISSIQSVPEPTKTGIMNYLFAMGCENAAL